MRRDGKELDKWIHSIFKSAKAREDLNGLVTLINSYKNQNPDQLKSIDKIVRNIKQPWMKTASYLLIGAVAIDESVFTVMNTKKKRKNSWFN